MKISFYKFILFCLFNLLTVQIQAQSYTLKFKTSEGNFDVLLYDFTPNHRDLILREIENGAYKKASFNRVIKNFVVQGGELDDVILANEALNPSEIKKRLNPEFHPKAFHKIGAIGAGRDDNPTKGSFFNQIYFVVGKHLNALDLEKIEHSKRIKFTSEQKEEYLKNGGQPRLDNDYTVFGEITKGLPIVLKISGVDTDEFDKPEQPIRFKIKVKKNFNKKNKTSISLGAGFGH